MLDADAKAQLKAYLKRLVQFIELVANVDDNEGSHDMMDLLRDVAEQSGMIVLTGQRDAAERAPSFLIHRIGADMSVRFAVIPVDHKFTSFVLALLQVGGYAPKPEASVIEQVRNIEEGFRFETHMSPTYQSCPGVVQALNAMSMINQRIQHAAIGGALFQGEIEARQIMAVSTVFLNGGTFGAGRMGAEEILTKIDTGATTHDAEKLATKKAFDTLIAGGGPTGAAVAMYVAHKGVCTGVVAERFGGQVFSTLGIGNLISVQETEEPKFAAALEQHARQYDVDTMNTQHTAKLTPVGKPDGFAEVTLANSVVLKGRLVILSTGARQRNVNVPGEREYKGKGVAYYPRCGGLLLKGKRVAVIDGDNSGVKAAIDLVDPVSHVTLLEFTSELKTDAVLAHKFQGLSNATIAISAQTTRIAGDGQKVNGLRYKSRANGVEHTVTLEGMFTQTDLVPNTEWSDGALERNRFSGIIADTRGQTSAESAFVVGDVIMTPHKQTITTTGDGAKAALSASDHLIRVPLIKAA